MLALEFQVVGGPGLDQQFLGFLHLLDAEVGIRAKADVFVGVVVGAFGSPDYQAALAQVVQKRGLDSHADGVVQG